MGFFSIFKGGKPKVSEFVEEPAGSGAKSPLTPARSDFYADLAAQEHARAQEMLLGPTQESDEAVQEMVKKIMPRTPADFRVVQKGDAEMAEVNLAVAATGGMAVAQDAAPAGSVNDAGLTPTQEKMLRNVDLYQVYGQINPRILRHFVSRAFIGYPACTVLGQHEIVGLCCSTPAEDAIASGFTISCTSEKHKNDHEHIEAEAAWLERLRTYAVNECNVEEMCVKFGTYKRLYGIGVAIPRVELKEGRSFEDPYDPDAIKPGTFKGFTVIDPSRICWDFDANTLFNPLSEWYQKPEYLRLVTASPNDSPGLGSERRMHRSWCYTANYREVGEDLLATYMYGGQPLSQLLYERVFCADTLANEIVALAMSKRTVVMERNTKELLMEPKKVSHFLERLNFFRTNNSVLFKEPGLNVQQLETSLADLQPLSAQQYQYAAAIAGIPVTKLLKNVPSGLQATGQYEVEDYEETVKPIRKDFVKLLNRWFELFLYSEYPERKDLHVSVVFNPFVSPKAAEQQQIASQKASMVCQLMMNSVISVKEARGMLKKGELDEFDILADETPEVLVKIEEMKDPEKQQQMQQQMQMQGGGAPGGMPGGAPGMPGAGGGQPHPPANPQFEQNKGVFQKVLEEVMGKESLPPSAAGGESAPGGEGANPAPATPEQPPEQTQEQPPEQGAESPQPQEGAEGGGKPGLFQQLLSGLGGEEGQENG